MSAVALEKSLPTPWYRDAFVFGLEKEHIFCREWIAVARAEQLPAPGDHRVIDVAGESILLVRNREGALRAFYNVCRHRGARLCRPDDEAVDPSRATLGGGFAGGRLIVCPYHQWSYDFDGALVAAPHVAFDDPKDKEQFHLYSVAVDTWGGFVFVNLSPRDAPPLMKQIASVAKLERYPLEDLRIGATIEYQVQANWKILCENYNECYHCGGVHPELCAVVPAFKDLGGANLDWDRGIPHRDGAFTFTHSGTTDRRPFPGLNEDERTRHKGDLVYPNLFLSLACDHAAVFILRARSAERTDITCHFLFERHEIDKPSFDASDAVDFWHLVNRQDWAICEAVQKGIRARVHTQGYYAPMEDWNLDIRRYVNDRIGRFVDPHPAQ